MALMGAIAKFLAPVQTAEAILFWRNLVGMVVVIPWIAIAGPPLSIPEKLKTQQGKMHLVRGVSSFVSVMLYYYSLKFLSLTTATLLFNTIPIFIPIVAYLWKGILIIHRLWWGLGVAFLGIIFAMNPGSDLFHPASFLALASGVTGAVSFVSLRFSSFSETLYRTLFYLFLVGMVCSGFLTLITYKTSWLSLDLHEVFWLILIGIAGLLYQIFLTQSSKFAPVRLIGIFIYTAVIYAMGIDTFVWKVRLSAMTHIGFFLILAGAVLLVLLYPKEDLKFKSPDAKS